MAAMDPSLTTTTVGLIPELCSKLWTYRIWPWHVHHHQVRQTSDSRRPVIDITTMVDVAKFNIDRRRRLLITLSGYVCSVMGNWVCHTYSS